MSPLSPALPPGAKLTSNILCSPLDLRLLVANVMLVQLPNDIEIDVGWEPEDDPSGNFRISVYQGDWDQQLIDPIEVRDPQDVVINVERLARKFSKPSVDCLTEWAAPDVSTSDFPRADASS